MKSLTAKINCVSKNSLKNKVRFIKKRGDVILFFLDKTILTLIFDLNFSKTRNF
jgi:hypothetical protein